jgi:predicted ribonuclease YlaK
MRKRRSATTMEEIPSIVPKSSSSKTKIRLEHLKTVVPLTENQTFAFQEYSQDQNLVLHGCAGTGKTLLSLYLALKDVFTKGTPYHKVIIIKSAVQTRELGFTKGTREEKEFEYVVPYISICNELFPNIENAYQQLVDQGVIQFMTTSFMRGITFNNSVIICDEMQQNTFKELDMVATRVGEDSRIIFSGDLVQSDLKKHEQSGFNEFMRIVKEMPVFTNIEFTVDDVVRSGFVKQYILIKLKLGL